MYALLNPRFLAALAGLIGVGVSLWYPALPEAKAVGLASTVLTFLAGLFQPQPGALPAATDKGASGPAANPK